MSRITLWLAYCVAWLEGAIIGFNIGVRWNWSILFMKKLPLWVVWIYSLVTFPLNLILVMIVILLGYGKKYFNFVKEKIFSDYQNL